MKRAVELWHRLPYWFRWAIILGLMLFVFITGKTGYMLFFVIPGCLEAEPDVGRLNIYFAIAISVFASIVFWNTNMWHH